MEHFLSLKFLSRGYWMDVQAFSRTDNTIPWKIPRTPCSVKPELVFWPRRQATLEKKSPFRVADFVLVERKSCADEGGWPQRLQPSASGLPLCWTAKFSHCSPLRSLLRPIFPSCSLACELRMETGATRSSDALGKMKRREGKPSTSRVNSTMAAVGVALNSCPESWHCPLR